MVWLRMRVALALLGAACSSGSLGPGVGSGSSGVGRARDPAVTPRLLDTDWGAVRLDSPALELRVPELSAWHAGGDGSGGSWTRIEHRSSASVLELWQVPAERRVRPADCEAKARLTRPDLWRPTPETTIDQQSLDAPPTYRTELTVGIEATKEGGTVSGFVIAFGAAASRCYALFFSTRARGKGAELEIGRRLDLVASRVLPSVTLRGVEDRVRPEPLP